MSPWLLNAYTDAGVEEVKMRLGLPGLLYADVLVLCGESEEDLRAKVGSFVGV